MGDWVPTRNTEEQECTMAISRWDTDGGSGPSLWPQRAGIKVKQTAPPQPANLEYRQLRNRVIALENLVNTLLAAESDRQTDRARDMAVYISPRSGSTSHPLTVHAASHMVDLVKRAEQFRLKPMV